jgi:hypothetical protein
MKVWFRLVHVKKVFLAVVTTTLLLALLLRHLPSTLYNNIGHLIWLRSVEGEKETAEAALTFFERAIALNPRYLQPQIGAALLNLQLGNESQAFSHWETGDVDSSILVAYADKEKNFGQSDRAMTLYADSARLGSRQGHILAGNLCQQTLYDPMQLSKDKQDFCETYFRDNANNLIVNGDFESGDFTGWLRRYWSGFSGRYLIDNNTNTKQPTAIIYGEKDKEVGAISQELTLKEDTTVRFSARLKADLQENAQARLLHIVWTRPGGMPGGNQLITIDESQDWEYLERTISLPRVERNAYTFSPVILTGKGKIWIDDVRLEIISED